MGMSLGREREIDFRIHYLLIALFFPRGKSPLQRISFYGSPLYALLITSGVSFSDLQMKDALFQQRTDAKSLNYIYLHCDIAKHCK